MDEMNELQEKTPTPKAPLPKLPFIIGGIVVGVAAITVAAVLLLGGGSHEHSFGEWKTVDEPTCLAAGIEERVCDCGDKEMRRIEALGHTEVTNDAVAPTCTEAGLTEGKHCSVCNTVILAQTLVEKIPHIYDNDNDADCNVCGASREIACTHAETEIVEGKDATCTATGLTEGAKCKNCGEIIVAQETIPVVAHTYDNKYDADCNVCGHKRDADCGHFETEVIPGKAATCTATGLTDGTKCSGCGETIVDQQTIPMVFHTFDNKYDEDCNVCGHKRDAECGHFETETIPGKAATCTATGLTDGENCKKCGEIIIAQTTVPMKPHTEVTDASVPATCTTTGLTEGSHCGVCDKVLVAQNTVPMKSHIEVTDAAVEATCTSTGLTEGKHCSVCSKVIVAQNIISASHQYPNNYEYDNEYHWMKCSACGIEKNKSTHIMNDEHTICLVCNPNAQPTEGIIYDVSADGTFAEVVGYNGTDVNVRIAETYNNLPVKCIYEFRSERVRSVVIPNGVEKIADAAFASCSFLTNIVIPDSVTIIGYQAFSRCVNLRNIILPDNLKSISWALFVGCTSLNKIVIPNSVITIEGAAFEDCKGLMEVTIGTQVISIEYDAFKNCRLLNNVIIPDSVQIIGNNAFANCTSLSSISIGNGVNIVGSGVFNGCDKLEYTEYENCKYIGNEQNPYLILFSTTNSNLSKYVINGNTVAIAGSAFYSCERLSKITIPSSVVSIGYQAFRGCEQLTEITIPNSVIYIGEYAFSYCAFETIVIPDSITELLSCVFEDTNIRNLILHKGITKIGYRNFRYNKVENIYYAGDYSEWKKIVIDQQNYEIYNATIHYNYTLEE